MEALVEQEGGGRQVEAGRWREAVAQVMIEALQVMAGTVAIKGRDYK